MSFDFCSHISKESIVVEAAELIPKHILAYASNLNRDDWPPDLKILQDMFDSIPHTVFDFFETLLKDQSHGTSERVNRLIRSYSCDMIHGVTLGKVITLKYYLLGLGCHNMSGQKLLTKILWLLGHAVSAVSDDTVNSSETALADLSQLQAESGTSSGLLPTTGESYVFTYFWADNFNKKVESDSVRMIDSTHMIKFHEITD